MDGSAAIERNRAALKRIVASLVDMAGLAGNAPFTSPSMGEVDAKRRVGVSGKRHSPACNARRPPHPEPVEGEPAEGRKVGGEHAATLPRHLYLFILRLLRPAEAAARRLIIAAARGLTVPPPKLPRRPEPEPKPQSMVPYMRKMGLAISPAFLAKNEPARSKGAGGRIGAKGEAGAELSAGRLPAFSLFDPPRRLFLNGGRRRTVPPHAAPRICVPGFSEPYRLPPPPSPEDPISAARLSQRIAALADALDDLPGQARRFARWRARRDAISAQERERHAAGAQEREFAASGGREQNPAPGRFRRTWPIRRGRPPGGRLTRWDPDAARDAAGTQGRRTPRDIREVDEILAHAHALAVHALEYPDTS